MTYRDYKNKIEELQKDSYSLLELEIVNEINCRIEKDYTDEELNRMMYKVENAYLKSDDVELWKIVKVVIDKFDEIENMSSWDVVEEACWI